jgi:hypothetical protein
VASVRRNALRSPTTASYYVYCVTFYSFDIPDSFRRHALVRLSSRSARNLGVEALQPQSLIGR